MTEPQEATPQQKLIDAINGGSLYRVIEAMRQGAKASDIPQDLLYLVSIMLQVQNFMTFRNDAFGGDTEDLKCQAAIAKELGGYGMVQRMLQAEDFGAFKSAAKYGHTETLKYLVELAKELSAGGDWLVTKMLQAKNFEAFRLAAESDWNWEAMYYLACHPLIDNDARQVVKNKLKPTTLNLAGIKPPSPDDFGEADKPYPYAVMMSSLSKIEVLVKGLGVQNCDIKQIIANHKNPRANVSVVYEKDKVNWGILSEVLSKVSYKDCNEIVDTVKEVTQYAAAYLLAQKYPDKTELKNLSKEELNEQLEPLKQQVYRYFLEGKTLPHMVKISNQWHKYRANRVKSSEDGTTLRDFAQSGSWKQTTETKEIAVTDPKLAGYTIENLTTSVDLMSEHHVLGHCIDSYVKNCKDGYQVFAIRKNGEPQTTMGFKVVDGKLQLDQHYGNGNRAANADEKAVEKWFLDGIEKGTIKLDLSNIGEIKLDEKSKVSEFEDLVGIRVEKLTPERLQSNLNLLTSFARGERRNWRESNTFYMFGAENNGATIEQFSKNIENGVKQQQIQSQR